MVAFTSRFNEVSFWVATQIVEARKMGKSASSTITFFIKVLKYMYELKNYSGMASVIGGMNNSSVQKLKESWSEVKEGDMKELEGLEKIVGLQENYRCYREIIKGGQLFLLKSTFFGGFLTP